MTTINPLSSLLSNQTSTATDNQTSALEQLLAQSTADAAQQTSDYGPPYVLDISAGAQAYVNGSSQSQAQSLQSGLQQLDQALKSGSLSSAAQAYSSLIQIPAVQTALQNDPNDPAVQDIEKIGSALQSNNLGQAQQAFSSLQQQVTAPAPSGSGAQVSGHHHHGGGGHGHKASSATEADSPADSAPDSVADSPADSPSPFDEQ